MTHLISVISECHSKNLGDQAIARAIRGILRPSYSVSATSFGETSYCSPDRLGPIGAITDTARSSRILSAIQPKTKSQVRWHILGGERKFAKHYAFGIKRSDLVLIGGGQLIKNNISLFCEKVALIAKLSKSADIPFALIGVGVDKKMEKRNWRIIDDAINHASFIILRDELSQGRIEIASKCIVETSVLPDPAFALVNPDRCRPESDRCVALAVNVMNFSTMLRSGDPMLKITIEDLIEVYRDLVRSARGNTVPITLFTTGSTEDLVSANVLKNHIYSEVRIELPIFHPETLDDLLAFLANSRDVFAARLHAGILAHISGCNTLCLNWDDKVQGVWSTVYQPERVVRMQDILHKHIGSELLSKFQGLKRPSFKRLDDLAEEVRRGVLSPIANSIMRQQAIRAYKV